MSEVKYKICPFCGTLMQEISTPAEEVINEFKSNIKFDWQAFRAEAAKDILCAFASNERIELSKDNIEKSVECSIALADILIIKLKGDGKD